MTANRFWVSTQDNRGNTASTNLVSQHVDVWQETGLDANGEPGIAVTRTGTWAVANCSCFNNGKTLYSTTKGASLSYKVTSNLPGETLGVVVEKSTNRGTVNISVDGAAATAVSTYAASAKHRVIVWQNPLSVGTHTVKLTNAGTSGRPRVDVDAIMLTKGRTTRRLRSRCSLIWCPEPGAVRSRQRPTPVVRCRATRRTETPMVKLSMHENLPFDEAVGPPRVSTGDLPMRAEIGRLVTEAYERYRSNDSGRVADYIPVLAEASPDLFGIAVVGAWGRSFEIGDVECGSPSRASPSRSSSPWSATRSATRRLGSASG